MIGMLALLLLTAPFIMVFDGWNYADLPKYVFIQVAALLIACVWLTAAIVRRKLDVPGGILTPPLTLLVFWALLSSLWAVDCPAAWRAWSHWGACWLVFAIIAVSAGRRGHVMILGAVYAAGIAMTALGFGQWWLSWDFLPQAIKPAGTFANKNMLAQFLLLTMPAGVYFLLTAGRRSWKWLMHFAAVGAMVFLLYVCRSKAAWLSALAGTLVVVAGLGLNRSWRWRFIMGGKPWLRLALVSVMLGCLILLAGGDKRLSFASVAGEVAAAARGFVRFDGGGGASGSVDSRLPLWANTAVMGMEHPVGGVGMGNFKVYFPLYHDRGMFNPYYYRNITPSRAHNDYLQVFAELGGVGAALALWLGVAFFVCCRRLSRRRGLGKRGVAAVCAAAALTAIAVDAVFSFPMYRPVPSLMTAVYLALLAGFGGGVLEVRRRIWMWPGLIFCLGWLVFSVFDGVRRVGCDRAYKKSMRLAEKGHWREAMPHALAAVEADPWNHDALSLRGSVRRQLGDDLGAEADMRLALRRNPNSKGIMEALGGINFNRGDYPEALGWYKKCVEVAPRTGGYHNEIGCNYSRLGMHRESLSAFARAVKYEPERASYHFNLGVALSRLGRGGEAEKVFDVALEMEPGLRRQLEVFKRLRKNGE